MSDLVVAVVPEGLVPAGRDRTLPFGGQPWRPPLHVVETVVVADVERDDVLRSFGDPEVFTPSKATTTANPSVEFFTSEERNAMVDLVQWTP